MTSLLLSTALAFADQAATFVSTPFCSGGGPIDTLPRSGASDLSPDTVVTLWFESGPGCPAPPFDATFTDEVGTPVPFHVETLGLGSVALVPDAPLPEGYYVATVTTDVETSDVWLRIGGEGLPHPTGVDLSDVDLRRNCWSSPPAPSIEGEARLEGSGQALFDVMISTDDVPGPWRTLAVTERTDTSLWLFEAAPAGLHEICLHTRLVDETLATVDEQRACWSSRACPAPPRDGILQLQCGTTPGNGAGLLTAAAVALLARRRR
jgi:MYXO-CTERM domain-containing protein